MSTGKRLFTVWLVSAGLAAGFATLAGVPEKVDLSYYKSDTKVSRFEHKPHVDRSIACTKCHHKPKGNQANAKCIECHKADGGKNASSYKAAFHKLCKGCHKEIVKARPESKAPVKCPDCHK